MAFRTESLQAMLRIARITRFVTAEVLQLN
jgi:hypothetical protein